MALASLSCHYGVSVKIGTKHTIPLLQPNCHLTSHTWGTFNRWVKENNPGWKAKRRVATAKEAEAAGAYNSGKSYFVDIIYQVIDPNKKKKAKKKNNDDDDTDKKPAAKKQKREPPKNRVGPFDFLSLPDALQLSVLGFANVPTLGALVKCSKQVSQLAKSDVVWDGHVRFLLKELFDDAFGGCDAVVPISQRPRLSTEFYAWLKECHDAPGTSVEIRNWSVDGIALDVIQEFQEHPEYYEGQEDRFTWLLQDVDLREYYKQAGAAALAGQFTHFESMEQAGRCPFCLSKDWDCCCRRGSRPPGLFDKMPNIKLFCS